MKKSERLKKGDSSTIRRVDLELDKKKERQKRLRAVFAVALVPLLFGAGYVVGDLTGNDGPAQEQNVSTTVEKVEQSVSGKSSDEDKADAVDALRQALILAGESKGDLDFEARLTQIDENNYEDVSPEFMEMLYWTDGLDERDGIKANSIQGMITLSFIAVQSGNADITPNAEALESVVYLDQQNGRAFVPVSVFLGPSNSMSVELVYDSESESWKIDPYSFVEALRLSASLQSSGGQPVPPEG